jgi:hypothetical protein
VKTVHLESSRRSKSTPLRLHTSDASIQKQDEGRADSAWSRYYDYNLLAVMICMRLKKIIKFPKGKPKWGLEKLYAQ